MFGIASSLTILLLFATTTLSAQPQLVASVAVEQLMTSTFSLRTLLTAAQPRPHRERANTYAAVRIAADEHPSASTEQTLQLRSENGQVLFYPTRPVLNVGQELVLQLQGIAAEQVEVYVREQNIAVWHAPDKRLTALQSGTTELVFIVAKVLHILPLQVRNDRAAPKLTAAIQPAAPQLVAPPTAGRFKLERAQIAYRNIEIQVVDERSTPAALYPVGGLQLSLLGSSLRLQTDARGIVNIAALPAAARLLLKLHDPRGRYVSALQEIYVQREQRRYQLVVRRDLAFNTMQTTIGRSQDSRLASLCAVIDAPSGEYGFQVESDVAADGAYYFNRLQLLAPQQLATAANNRFCLFNIDPGPLTLFITDADGQRRAVFTVGLAAGHHREEVFTIAEHPPYRSWVAVAGDMHLPLHAQQGQGDDIVDFVQMRLVGDDRYFAKVEDGLLESVVAPDWHHGRSYVVTHAAEFENTLYQINAEGEMGLVPLLTRGFIENTALLAAKVHDATRGSVVIEHGARRGEDTAEISLRLIAADGTEHHPAWSLQDDGVTRSIFLNLDYGIYQAVAQNADAYWLAASTVVVYSETVSFLRTGAAVAYGKTP